MLYIILVAIWERESEVEYERSQKVRYITINIRMEC